MDELGFNKIAAAILATGLGFMGLKEVSHKAMHVSAPDVPAYRIAVVETNTGSGEAVDLPFPQASWIAAMDAERGAKVFKKCTSCHNAEDGGANGTGPNLWNIVGQSAAQKDGFNYSAPMKNGDIVWDYETLDGFLKKPTKYLSGTAMNFVGLKKEEDRAAVIEYLRIKSASPVAQPVAVTMDAPEEDLGDTLEAAIEDGGEMIDDAPDAVVDGVEDVAEDAGNVATEIVETIEDAAVDAVETVTDEDATEAVEEDPSKSEE